MDSIWITHNSLLKLKAFLRHLALAGTLCVWQVFATGFLFDTSQHDYAFRVNLQPQTYQRCERSPAAVLDANWDVSLFDRGSDGVVACNASWRSQLTAVRAQVMFPQRLALPRVTVWVVAFLGGWLFINVAWRQFNQRLPVLWKGRIWLIGKAFWAWNSLDREKKHGCCSLVWHLIV